MVASLSLVELLERIERGGPDAYHRKNEEQGKSFARDRIAMLVDKGTFVEDGSMARCLTDALPADAVITGTARVDGRVVAIMANDSTVKAGSWGSGTVEKILRIQETARDLRCPLLYLVDSAGARITDQVKMFPGRRGAGRIFFNQVELSGYIPQICLLFGPSAAGGAYIPAFCDVVVMVDQNASMYLGSPRMAEVVIGETCSLEQMGGARMHCTVSGCGDVLVTTEKEALAWARRYLSYMPSRTGGEVPMASPKPPALPYERIEEVLPEDEGQPYDMMEVLKALIDEGSWIEIKPLYAKELITGLCRIEGRTVGVVANQPKHLGGVLFVESANKAARFIQLCNAFDIPLLFLSDVPGFMIGSKVEQQGIIRAGAKMIAAVSAATVPKISVIVRKAYGAGLYAMCGPAFEPDACLALPSAAIGVMGPAAAVNAVYYNKIHALPEGEERESFIRTQRREYEDDIDLYKLADDLVIDAIVPPSDLRRQLANRLSLLVDKQELRLPKKNAISPM
jgi:acetyl-CoA carboxylase carboxyltransferase component